MRGLIRRLGPRAGILVLLLSTVVAAGPSPGSAGTNADALQVIAKSPPPGKGPPWRRGGSRQPERPAGIATPSAEREPTREPRASREPSGAPTAPAAEAPAAPPSREGAQAAAPAAAARNLRAPAAAGLALLALAALGLARTRRPRGAPAPGAPTLVEPVAAPQPPRAPRALGADGRYELLERIGAGGMGVVYRAHDRRLDREVALKRLSEQLVDHPKAVRYFQREARAIAALNHRHIVTLYDVDEDEGVPFLTMELLEGWNLAQIVSMRGPFSSADTARLGAQAAAGLACAHARGIVHRDVKSGNLFLTRERIVKVMDFGLAKVAEELRRSGTVVGTPQYIAPEQAAGRDVDARADLYALGVTLFQLATARCPFEDGDLLHHHRHTPPPDPRSIRPDVAPVLAEIILACLAKEPEKRPATADELAQRLRASVAR